MLIVGGVLIPIALQVVNDQNKLMKKVQKTVIFTRNYGKNKHYNDMYQDMDIAIF